MFVKRYSQRLSSFGSVQKVASIYDSVMKGAGTQHMMDNVVCDATMCHWDGFLGKNDTDKNGNPLHHCDDRLYTTAMSLNALVDTWTEPTPCRNNKGECLRWSIDTPPSVQAAVERGVEYVSVASLNGTRQDNAFFSGSVKGPDSQWFWFPANHLMFVNGTKILPPYTFDDIEPSSVLSMKGVLSADEYEKMVANPIFGEPTPVVFNGYNNGSWFPYWSSDAITTASSLAILTKADAILESNPVASVQ